MRPIGRGLAFFRGRRFAVPQSVGAGFAPLRFGDLLWGNVMGIKRTKAGPSVAFYGGDEFLSL